MRVLECITTSGNAGLLDEILRREENGTGEMEKGTGVRVQGYYL